MARALGWLLCDYLKTKLIAEGDAENLLKVGVEMVGVILEDPVRQSLVANA